MQTLNPVLLTERSTQKLPRLLLLSMFIAYAFSGLIGRDPWRGDDALGFGIALSMAQGQSYDNGLLQVAGASITNEGPLWFGIVALFIRVFSFIPAHIVAYLPVALSLLLALAALWYATYYVARTPAAQPLSLAMGGQPKPMDYGWAVADGASLIVLATLGIAIKLHELSAESFQFCLHACMLLGVSMSLYKPRLGAYFMLTSVFALGLNRGLPAAAPALMWCLLMSAHPAWLVLKHYRIQLILAAACGVAGPILLAFLFSTHEYAIALIEWNLNVFGWGSLSKWFYFFSNLLTIGWPTVPFAIAAVWRWRSALRAPHMWLGVSYCAVMLLATITQNTINEASFLTIIPGAVILAAFLLPALPRTWMNAIDWFGVMVLSLITLLAWIGWFAMTWGWPAKLAHNILRITPHFDRSVQLLACCIAIGVTLFWMFVVRWRITRATTVIWRAAVIWSAGTLTIWVLIGTLWMPWLNYGKSYRAVATELKYALKDHTQCVSPVRLGLPQRAVLSYFGDLRFEPSQHTSLTPTSEQNDLAALENTADTPATVNCLWLLEYDSLQSLSSRERLPYQPAGQWKLVWEGRRYTDKDERFRLFQKQ